MRLWPSQLYHLLVFSTTVTLGLAIFSGSCYENYGMVATTCDEAASAFGNLGSTWYECYQTKKARSSVAASCDNPYCNFQFISDTEVDEVTPVFNAVIAVFVATALVLAGASLLVAFACFPAPDREASVKQVIKKRMCIVTRCIYQVSFAPFVDKDGLPAGFCDFFCDKKELFGLLDCRKKTAIARPRWMRLVAIATTFMATLSLSLVFGAVVHNEDCYSMTTVHSYKSVCSCETLCDGVNLGCTDGCQCMPATGCWSYTCDGAVNPVTEVTIKCISDDITLMYSSLKQRVDSVSSQGKAITVVLTLVMAKANSVAIGSAEDASKRQKLLHLATLATAAGLLIFGIAFANSVSKPELDENPGAIVSRQKAILQTLAAGWGYEQVAGSGLIVRQWIFYRICYRCWYKSKLEAVKSAGAAAVHPHALDATIMKTDGIKDGAAASEPVATDEVKLDPPTQQQ